MKIKGEKQPMLPSRPPISLFIVAILFLMGAIFISPEFLIRLGPMKQSITSAKDLVRHTTLREINILRALWFILFITIIGVLILWKKLLQNKFIISVTEYTPLAYENQRHSIINFSFILIMIPLIGVILFVMFGNNFNTSTLNFIMREDGLVEWSTASIFLINSIVSILIVFRESSRPKRIIHILFAIFFFVCSGEEISWGQRTFYFGTPEIIKETNVQGEFNLHNLSGYFADHIFIAGVFFYGVILTAMNSIYPFCHRLFRKFGLPIPSIGLAIGFFFLSLMHDWTIYRIFPPKGIGMAELRELLSSIAFLLLMCESAIFSFNQRKFIIT